MLNLRRAGLVVALCFGAASAAWAQRMGMGQVPRMPGQLKPVVGSGAEYEMTTQRAKMDIEYAIVGKESVDGQDGYWMEMRMKGGQGAGTITKQLIVVSGETTGIMRMIVQPPGRGPMEMPTGMMGMASKAATSSGKGMGEKVGTEPVVVPGGTFLCDHYKSSSGGDFWVSTKVSPYGLVKMTASETSMVLLKVLDNQTSQIKGEPEKMGGMMPH